MSILPLAGKPAPKEMLVDVARLERDYFERRPDLDDPEQRVTFGTSGHRGSSLHGSFTEAHILAITQAICDFRRMQGIDGPLFMGRDTHALSGPAQHTALGVLAGNHVQTVIQENDGVTPTPVISRQWPAHAAVGKTLVSSGMIDRVVEKLGRRLYETPVGFKWFVSGLFDGSCCFGGEESAGASFLRHDGSVWTTDKDGPLMGLLAAEIMARTGKEPGEHYRELTAEFGAPSYVRIDAPATSEQKARLKNLSPEAIEASCLAGEPIVAKLSRAPANNAAINGLKVIASSGWFAARPSGTEAVYKIYAESFKGEAHLDAIVREARHMVNAAVLGSGAPAIESGCP
jgi:phosphoglucomutase